MDFAFRGAGDVGQEVEAERVGDEGGEGGVEGGGGGGVVGDDAGDEAIVGLLDEGDVGDGAAGEDGGFEVGGGNFGAAEVEDVLVAAGEFEAVLRGEGGDVAGVEPAVLEHGGGGGGVVQVGGDHAGGADAQRPGLAWRGEDFGFAVGEEADGVVRCHGADGAEFVGAVIFA